MRNGQKRMRGRNHRKSQNPLTRVYESNGPDVKIRGTASHIAEKYIQLARDAQGSGDPVAAENYYQHAEHYFRLIAAAQEQFRQQNPYYNQQQQQQGGNPQQLGDDFDDEGGDDQPFMGQNEPGYQQNQPQPYMPREAQPFPQQHYNQHQNQNYGGRPQHQQHQPHYQQQGQQGQQNPQQGGGDGNDPGLPSFITGAGPQQGYAQNSNQNFGNGHEQNDHRHDRYNHRRRRRHRGGYRPDRQDFGNQQSVQNQNASQNLHDAGGDEPHQPNE